jgi:HAD superfamily hydrolase (TIGR01490 family)
MAKPNIHIFDLDRTITRHPTYTPFLFGAAQAKAPWRLALVPLLLPFLLAYGCKLLTRKGLKQIMHAMFLGRRVAREDVFALAEHFADNMGADGLFSDIKGVIETALSAGERVMIATASHRFYVEALARKLGVTDIIATGSVWDGDQLTPIILGENCYGAGKLRKLKAYFDTQDLDRDAYHLIFYSDHISDLPCFEYCDEPIAKNASPKLLALARQRRWRVM